MVDYAAMYQHIFNAITSAVEILQQAQLDTEEMYISAPDLDIRVLKLPKPEDENKETE